MLALKLFLSLLVSLFSIFKRGHVLGKASACTYIPSILLDSWVIDSFQNSKRLVANAALCIVGNQWEAKSIRARLLARGFPERNMRGDGFMKVVYSAMSLLKRGQRTAPQNADIEEIEENGSRADLLSSQPVSDGGRHRRRLG